MIAVLLMTDGRDFELGRSTRSWHDVMWSPLVTERWIHDDTGNDEDRASRASQLAMAQLGSGPRRGFGGALAHAWSELAKRSSARYVLHLEDDILLSRPLDLAAMVGLLDSQPHLAQLALRRAPYYEHEKKAGGVVEVMPDAWTDAADRSHRWLERERWWTCNPCIYRRSLCERGWPRGSASELNFAARMEPNERSAYWGGRDEPPYVEHIGHERLGHGY